MKKSLCCFLGRNPGQGFLILGFPGHKGLRPCWARRLAQIKTHAGSFSLLSVSQISNTTSPGLRCATSTVR